MVGLRKRGRRERNRKAISSNREGQRKRDQRTEGAQFDSDPF